MNQVPENEQRREKIITWILLSLNVLFPVIETVFELLFYTTYFIRKQQASNDITQILNSASLMVCVIQIASGVLLVHGVIKIIKSISIIQGSLIKKTTLLVHAGAFGLYLLSLTVLFATEVPYNLNP